MRGDRRDQRSRVERGREEGAGAGRATTRHAEEAITDSLWSRSTRWFFHLGEVNDFHT